MPVVDLALEGALAVGVGVDGGPPSTPAAAAALAGMHCAGEPVMWTSVEGMRDARDPWGRQGLRAAYYRVGVILEEAVYLLQRGRATLVDEAGRAVPSAEAAAEICAARSVDFATRLTAYSHYRDLGWVIRSGSNYGGTYTLYTGDPNQHHSSHIVLLRTPSVRDPPWTTMQTVARLAPDVLKALRLCEVSEEDGSVSDLGIENAHVLAVDRVAAGAGEAPVSKKARQSVKFQRLGRYAVGPGDVRVLLLTGLPGSGKSTLAARLVAAGGGEWVAVSQDALGSREAAEAAAREALAAGRRVVVDRVHADSQQRSGFIRIGDKARPRAAVAAVVVECPLEQCVERVLARAEHPTLPADSPDVRGVVERFAEGLRPPEVTEGFVAVVRCATAGAAVDEVGLVVEMFT